MEESQSEGGEDSKGSGKSMGFAKDIGEKTNQTTSVNTSTGAKHIGYSSGNPNIRSESPVLLVSLIAIAVLIALFIYLRWR